MQVSNEESDALKDKQIEYLMKEIVEYKISEEKVA